MSQLADMFKGLMFLHGHILRPEDVAPIVPRLPLPVARKSSTMVAK